MIQEDLVSNHHFVSLDKKYENTVDGRNPAPVEVSSLSHDLKGFIHPRWCSLDFWTINCIFPYRNMSFPQSFEASPTWAVTPPLPCLSDD